MTGVIAALAGARGNPYIGSAVVTVGTITNSSGTSYGYDSFQGFGSITPSTWGGTGFTFARLYYINYTASPPATWIEFWVNGYAPNSGWDTITIAGVPLNRASAAIYSTDNATYTSWVWSPSSNLFGTVVGAAKAISWA